MLIAVKFLANINHNFLLSIIYCVDFSEKILQAMFKDIPKKEIAATFASVGDVNRAAELLLLKKCKILISFCHSSGTYQIQGGRFLAFKDLASFLLLLYMTWYCFLSILTFKPIQWLPHPSTPTDIWVQLLCRFTQWCKQLEETCTLTNTINQSIFIGSSNNKKWMIILQTTEVKYKINGTGSLE